MKNYATTELLNCLEICRSENRRAIDTRGYLTSLEANRVEEIERELLRRGDERRMLGLRDENDGTPIYDESDLVAMAHAFSN